MTDKGLSQVFHLSCRCVCLMVTMVVLVSIVGYVFVAIQSIWTPNLRAEVDRLARTNDLLEDNNDRFQSSNQELKLQVGRLQGDVRKLNESLVQFSSLNSELEGNILALNDSKLELEYTVDDFTTQGAQLQEQVEEFTNQTQTLNQTVAQLNQTSQRLEDELQLFQELEQNIANFADTSRGSFESILNSTQSMLNEVTKSTIANLQSTLFLMVNNIEYSDGAEGFSRSEYTEMMARFAFVLTQTEDELLEQYPFQPPVMSFKPQIDNIIESIVQRETQQLEQSSPGSTKGWFAEDDIGEEFGNFIFNMNRKMLFVM
eukprot:TRINITY_DN5430_c0_g1_i5.p1 TRINITY_DN5430_c0_g1~~TRINITY_DN5430_c0_g1_i5.p1  ORF type:complete len:316 (+),score=40.88 TRINITY_DN5430_c0_g1_i5:146-1093(+)